MKNIFLFILVVSGFVLSNSSQASLHQTKSLLSKIVGGTSAKQGDFPYIVSLQANGFGHFCGGSLIAQRWVLTAAHCVVDGVDDVWVGLYDQTSSNSAEKIKPAAIYVHPQNDPSTHAYDFALIELSQNSSYKPVLINQNEIIFTNSKPVMAVTAGWGTTSEGASGLPDVLRKVSVPLVTKAACNVSYAGAITDDMICAGYKKGGKDSCQGDSGGPLVVKNSSGKTLLAGVVSWGEGCARKNKYGVYGKVNAVSNWIKSTAGIK